MKGLLMKDVSLLKGQKQFFGVMAVIMFFFIFAYENYSFVISYITIMFSLFVITTMSYDDYEKGMCYLMCLPFSRREYVKEKYVFAVLSVLFGLTVVILATVIAMAVKKDTFLMDDILAAIAVSILIAAFSLGTTLPLHLKFGSEKSRLALMMVFGVIFLGGCVIVKLCEFAEIDVEALLDKILFQNMMAIMAGVIAVAVAVVVISYLISARIMMKREF